MLAAAITEIGHVEVIDAPEPVPTPDEVKVEIDLVGICATDVHMLHGTFPAAGYPVRPGHEATGTVVQAGDAVKGFAVGDRVVLDPGVPCGRCALCRDGRPNLCQDRRAYGVNLPGAGAEFMVAPASNWYVVDRAADPAAAVLAEPLACVVHALDLVRSPQGQDVLIYGAGTVGLLAMKVVSLLGARSITMIDRAAGRLRRAQDAGASVAESAGATGIDEWQLVIDATGAPAAIADGLGRVERGGTFLQIGVAPPESTVPLSPYAIFQRELKIQGSMTTRHSFPRAISLIEEGQIDAKLFSETPFGLHQYVQAIESSGAGEIPKALVSPRR